MDVERDRGQAVDHLLRRSRLSGAVPATSGPCLDAETLAAWVDGGLGGEDLVKVEQHVSDCPRCRALTATLVASLPAAVAPSPWWRGWRLGWLVPLAAATAAVALWVAVPYDTGSSPSVPPAVQPQAAGPSQAKPSPDQLADPAQPAVDAADRRRSDEVSLGQERRESAAVGTQATGTLVGDRDQGRQTPPRNRIESALKAWPRPHRSRLPQVPPLRQRPPQRARSTKPPRCEPPRRPLRPLRAENRVAGSSRSLAHRRGRAPSALYRRWILVGSTIVRCVGGADGRFSSFVDRLLDCRPLRNGSRVG